LNLSASKNLQKQEVPSQKSGQRRPMTDIFGNK